MKSMDTCYTMMESGNIDGLPQVLANMSKQLDPFYDELPPRDEEIAATSKV